MVERERDMGMWSRVLAVVLMGAMVGGSAGFAEQVRVGNGPVINASKVIIVVKRAGKKARKHRHKHHKRVKRGTLHTVTPVAPAAPAVKPAARPMLRATGR